MENLNSIKNFFKSHEIPLCDVWSESCLQWLHEENPNTRFTEKELQRKVYDQWLLLDLRDVEMPSLPPNLNTQVKFVLERNYSLQLLYIIDISKPKYMQLQKIRNSSISQQNKEEKVASNRVLQLTLTDGVQEIIATEYKYIPCLNTNLTPGIKIRLKGPITVRRGRLLLEDKNIEVLGGEVEELLVTNAAENILAKALQLEINPNPKVIEETFVIVDKVIPEEHSSKASNIGGGKTNLIENRNANANVINEYLNPQLDECIDEIETEIKSQQFCNYIKQTTTSIGESKKCKSPDLFEDDFDSYDFDEIKEMITPQKKIGLSESSPKFYHINEITANGSTYGIFKIKAKFKSVKEKLFINEGKFYLKIAIEDETGELVVSVHPDVLLSLSGRSASVIENLNKGAVDRAVVIQILMDLGMKIKDLDCAMDIEYKPEDDCPTIIQLYN